MNLSIPPVTSIIPVSSAGTHPESREERQQDLRLHQMIRATVAEGGQERVLLELGRQRFAVETQMPLKPGQKLDLMVVATSPRLELQVVEDPLRARLGQMLHLLSGRWNDSALLDELAENQKPLLERLGLANRQFVEGWTAASARAFAGRDGALLRGLARMLGLDLEARLARGEAPEGATLKSIMGELQQALKQGGGELAERAGQLLQTLELFQLSQVRLEQQGSQFVPMLLPGVDQGFLVAERRESLAQESGEESLVVSLHLSLQGLGDLRVDFLQDAQGLMVRFVCADRNKADFAAGFGEELRQALEPLGLQGLSFTGGAESPATALIRKLLPEGDRVLDTRV